MTPFTGERCTVLFQGFIVTNIIWECALLPMEKELFHDVLYFLFWSSESCWMQEVWRGHSFSYKGDKNYSVDFSWSHTDPVSPTVEPTNSSSSACCLLFLPVFHKAWNYAGEGEMALKLEVEWLHKQDAWIAFLCPKSVTGKNWHKPPFFFYIGILCLEVPWECVSKWDGVTEHGICWTKYEP